jgi:hypothetical protein
MKLIWIIILRIVGIIVKFKTKLSQSDNIRRDSELADKIRNGDGVGVAEDFKKRKYYE